MAHVLPLVSGGALAGSAVLVAQDGDVLYAITSLHLLGSSPSIHLAIPPHQGSVTNPQLYPLNQVPTAAAGVVATDPFADLALLQLSGSIGVDMPRLARDPKQPPVGTEIVVLGYPFAPIGSMLETWTPGWVTARARQQIHSGVTVEELVLSVTAHPGSSGSAVVGKNDGVLYGILRGALAPPEVLRIGNVPIATDTTVTFATSATYIEPLLDFARRDGVQ